MCQSCIDRALYIRKKVENGLQTTPVDKALNPEHNGSEEYMMIEENQEQRMDTNEWIPISEVYESTNVSQTIQTTKATQTNHDIELSEKSNIVLGLSRTRISHSKCIICNKGGFKNSIKKVKLHLISQYTIRQTLKQRNIYIPYGSRCCSTHIKDNEFTDESIAALNPTYSQYVLNENNVNSIKILVEGLLDDAVNSDIFFKFKYIDRINDDLCLRNTGYNKDQFIYINEYLAHYEDEFKMRNTSERSLSQALAVYLYCL